MRLRKFLAIIMSVLVIGVVATGCGKGDSNSKQVNLSVVGSTSVGPHIDAIAKEYMANNPGVVINVEQVGSGQGINSVQDGSANIGMSSRALKEEEKPMKEYRLCLDGISVVVSPGNSLSNLTMDQVKSIYLGEITNWKEVGGNDAKINVYTRESTSGTRGAFEELVLGKDANGEELSIDETICAAVQNSNGQLGTGVKNDPNAIGYLSMGLVDSLGVKALSVNDVAATADNVKAGTYKISRPFLLLTLLAPEGATADFIEFAMNSDFANNYFIENHFIK